MSSPKMPKAPALPAPPPAPPTVDQAALNVDQNNLLRKRRGRAADLLAPVDSAGPSSFGARQLLG